MKDEQNFSDNDITIVAGVKKRKKKKVISSDADDM